MSLAGATIRPFAIAISPSGADLYVDDWDTLLDIDTASVTVKSTIYTGTYTGGIALAKAATSSGYAIYFADSNATNASTFVAVIDPQTHSVLAKIPGPAVPLTGVAADHTQTHVYAAGQPGGLLEIDTGTLTGTIVNIACQYAPLGTFAY